MRRSVRQGLIVAGVVMAAAAAIVAARAPRSLGPEQATQPAVPTAAPTLPTTPTVVTPPVTPPVAPPAAPPVTPPAAPPVTPPAVVEPELTAEIATRHGVIRLRLMTREAPLSCANFVNLALRGAYDGATFDDWTRVLRQSGGPIHGFNPGYTIRREFNAKLMFDAPGKVALQPAAAADQAHPTQFFITTKEQPRWDLQVPIFAIVQRGQSSVDAIEKGDAITSITIQGDPTALLGRFTAHIAQWNETLDAAVARAALPPLRSAPATTAPAAPHGQEASPAQR